MTYQNKGVHLTARRRFAVAPGMSPGPTIRVNELVARPSLADDIRRGPPRHGNVLRIISVGYKVPGYLKGREFDAAALTLAFVPLPLSRPRMPVDLLIQAVRIFALIPFRSRDEMASRNLQHLWQQFTRMRWPVCQQKETKNNEHKGAGFPRHFRRHDFR